jgi:hypothetical protein
MRLVQIFDKPCCGPSAAEELATFLSTRVDAGGVTVEYHNLADGGAQQVKVPGALVGHLTGGGALPVIAVDGELVATGTLPNLMDALDLANGQPARTVLTMAGGASGEACAPGCC